MAAEERERREAKLVNEWLAREHPTALQWKRVRVGPIPNGPNKELYGVLRRWADIIFFDGEAVHMVEAKIKPEPGAISQLMLYAKLFPTTPEFTLWHDKPIKLHVLTTILDPAVKELAEDQGIEYHVYTPPWAVEYLRNLGK